MNIFIMYPKKCGDHSDQHRQTPCQSIELSSAVPACRDPSMAAILWTNKGEKKWAKFSQCRKNLTVLEDDRCYQYFQTLRSKISSIVYFWSYGHICLRVQRQLIKMIGEEYSSRFYFQRVNQITK